MLLRRAVLGGMMLVWMASPAMAQQPTTDVVFLLDPALKQLAPTLTASLQKPHNFMGVWALSNQGGALKSKAQVVVGKLKTSGNWRYLFEIGKPAARPGLFAQVALAFPYTLHFREAADQKSVVLMRGSVVSVGNSVERAAFGFADVVCISSLPHDLGKRLGQGLLAGKPTAVPDDHLPKAWYPATIVAGNNGPAVQIVLNNKTPVPLSVNLTLRDSLLTGLQDREILYPIGGSPLVVDPGQQRTILLSIADMSGLNPAWVHAQATPIDSLVTPKP